MTNGFIKLRDYQDEAVMACSKSICNGNKYTVLVSPTGSGKSLMMSAIAARVKSLKKISGIICAPFESIEDSFLKGDRRLRILDDVKIKRCDSNIKMQGLIADDIIADFSSVDIFYDYRNTAKKRSDGSGADCAAREIFGKGKFVVTTHQQVTEGTWKTDFFAKRSSLDGKLLVIDEAHHVTIEEENILGAFTKQWVDMGGQVLMVTATPYRLDGKSVIPEGAYIFSRTIAEHSSSGYAPNNFEIGVVSTDIESKTEKEFSGEESCENYFAAISSMILAWERDGKPKAVFNVPPGKSEAWAKEIIRVVDKKYPEKKVKVENAVGCENKIEELLASESEAKDYESSKVDIFVACKRFEEGTDWRFCSHVYNWGVPRSFGLIVQRWGRSFRDKSLIINYPEKFKNIASIKFFVTKIDKDKLDKKHKEHVWLISAYLYDWETAKSISHVYRNSFKSTLKEVLSEEDDENLAYEVNDILCDTYINDIDKTAIISDLSHIQKIISDSGEKCTIGAIMRYVESTEESLLSSSKEEILNVLANKATNLAIKNGTFDEDKAKEIIRSEVIRSNYPSSSLDVNFRKIYLKIIKEYSDLTVDLYEGIASRCSMFTGEDVAEITERLKESYEIFKKVNPEIVKTWVKKYHEKHMSLPGNSSTENSKEFSGLDATWSTVSDRLKAVSGKNFFDLGVDLGIVKDLSIASITDVCNEFISLAGYHPSINSTFKSVGIRYFMIDRTKNGNRLISSFNSIHKWLSDNGHGSLNSFLGLPTNTRADYTEQDVAGWIFDHMSNNNFSSLPENTDVCTYHERGSTWSAVSKKFSLSILQIAVDHKIIKVLDLSDLKDIHDEYYSGDREDKGDGKLYAIRNGKKLSRFLFSNINNLYRAAKKNFNQEEEYFKPNIRTFGKVSRDDIYGAVESYYKSNGALPKSEDSSFSDQYSGHHKTWVSIAQLAKKICDGKNFVEIGVDLGIVKVIDKDNVYDFIKSWKENNGGMIPSVITPIGCSDGCLYSIKKEGQKLKSTVDTFVSINRFLKDITGKQISETFRESSNLTFDFSDEDLLDALCKYYDGSIDSNTKGRIPGKNSGDASEYFNGTKKKWEYFYDKNNSKTPERSFANILHDAGKISCINEKTLKDIILSFKEINGRLPNSKDILPLQNFYYIQDEETGKINTVPVNTFQSINKNISNFGYNSISDFATINNI